MEENNVIYAAYCDKTNEFYIGRSCHPAARFRQHLKDENSPLYERAKIYGEQHIFFFIVKSGLSRKEAEQFEAKYIYEKYPIVKLINRHLPPSSYLLPFCSDDKQTDRYKALALKIEEDMANGIGCFSEAKVRHDIGGRKHIRCGTEPFKALKIALGESYA